MENYKSISTIVTDTLSRKTDQRQLSPNNIHILPREMVMRTNEMITKEKML